ncbi:MAG: ParB/RepB/Spo0J family partition protein, partial [Acutalibacteraceae bacterium]|nr:ParB/RepB/Spo0J family partition protein [Acutalibacteraceae bacterium]
LHAAQKAGIVEIPALIYALDRDSAAIAVVDSNLHREHILPSEKAFAYKLKMEALNHRGITCGQVGHKSRDDVSDTESGRTVQRYIRLTNLIPELLDYMDEGKMALSVGVELSYLDDQSQYDVLEQCEQNDCTPSYSQAFRMHKADREGLLTKAVIQGIMCEEKPNQRETIKIPAEKLLKFAPNTDPKQLEDFVLKACEHYRRYLIRQRERDR